MSDPVLELINKNSLAYTVSGRDYLIKCLNPEHDDSNPSFRVDKISGIAHCFSCGFKTNLFKYYGVFTNPVPIKVAALKEKLAALRVLSNGLELPAGHTPYTKSFRGISAQTLREFEAFYTHKIEKLEDRIVFPIKDITGKTTVFVARHTLSSGNPRYVNYPAGAEMSVFPTHVPPGYKSVVLVEGIMDMLNLYDKGMRNAVCAFGTNTIQHGLKSKLLPFKAQGVTHVFILFDADEPGIKAATSLKPMIEEEGFVVEVLKLPDGTDPGDLGIDDIRSIMEYTDK